VFNHHNCFNSNGKIRVEECFANSDITEYAIFQIFENQGAGEDVQTGLFVIEISFTVLFLVIIVYELFAYGLKESVANRGWLNDAIIVLVRVNMHV